MKPHVFEQMMLQMSPSLQIVCISFFLISNSFENESSINFEQGKVIFLDQNITFNIEVARTERQKNLGLMYRKQLHLNNGMLFVFEQEQKQRVWMKDTLIPLDVIFISKQGEIVSVTKDLQPCIKNNCRVFVSTKNAKYMLEVNAGAVKKNGVEIGQQLSLDF